MDYFYEFSISQILFMIKSINLHECLWCVTETNNNEWNERTEASSIRGWLFIIHAFVIIIKLNKKQLSKPVFELSPHSATFVIYNKTFITNCVTGFWAKSRSLDLNFQRIFRKMAGIMQITLLVTLTGKYIFIAHNYLMPSSVNKYHLVCIGETWDEYTSHGNS